nr:hypothetical protein [Rhizobium indicum]
MKRTIVPIFCEEGWFAGSAAKQENRKLNVLFQMHGLKNSFAFTLHDADLKQYIFAFSGGCPMPTREQAMALLYGCMELLDKVSRSGAWRMARWRRSPGTKPNACDAARFLNSESI